jgi:hypothetical protein
VSAEQTSDLFAWARAQKLERQQALAEALTRPGEPDTDSERLDEFANLVAERIVQKLREP